MNKSSSKQEQLHLLWFRITGAIILVMSFLICRMDESFLFCVPQHMRPILTLVLYLLIWFTAYFFALERIRKIQTSDNPTMNLIWIFFVGLVIRILFFPPHAIQETDFFRYFWDGQAVVQGANPYSLSPQEAYLLPEKPAINTLECVGLEMDDLRCGRSDHLDINGIAESFENKERVDCFVRMVSTHF